MKKSAVPGYPTKCRSTLKHITVSSKKLTQAICLKRTHNPKHRKCAVPGCPTEIKSTLKHFKVPTERRMQDIWLKRIRSPALFKFQDAGVVNTTVVCAVHFDPMCFRQDGRLLKFSLPTLNLPNYCGDSCKENCFSYPPSDVIFGFNNVHVSTTRYEEPERCKSAIDVKPPIISIIDNTPAKVSLNHINPNISLESGEMNERTENKSNIIEKLFSNEEKAVIDLTVDENDNAPICIFKEDDIEVHEKNFANGPGHCFTWTV